MRKSYLLLIFVVLLSGLFGKLYADYPKFPLLERFTNASCGPCADYNNRGYSDWVAANHNKLVIITYHWYYPGPNDPLYLFNKDMSLNRMNFYGFNGVPNVCMGGVEQGQITNAGLNTLLTSETAKRSPMNVIPTMEIINDTAKIHVDVVSDNAMNNIRLQVLILESVVTYDQAPGTNGERVFPYVARYAMPSMNGTSLTIGAGETKSFNFNQALDASLKQGRLYVVAFVEPTNTTTTTRSIVQAGMSAATVPMPKVIEPKLEYSTTPIYVQAKKDSIITHTIMAKNVHDYDVQLENIKVTNTFDDSWEFVSTTIPDITPIIKPGDSLIMEYNLRYIGDNPNAVYVVLSLDANITSEAYNTITEDNVRLLTPASMPFINISDDTKYIYLTGLGGGDNNVYTAFSGATYFEDKLVNIPVLNIDWFYYIFKNTNIIDSLEFLGIYGDDYFLINDALNGSNVMNKLKALPDLKLFLNLSGMTYYNMARYTQQYPTECAAANNFIIDMFGVQTANIQNYLMPTYDSETEEPAPVNLKGVANDPIAEPLPSLTLNDVGSIAQVYYMCLFDIASTATTTSVYTTNYSLLDRTIMAKYQNNTNRRVITGFDFATLNTLPATARPIEIVANAIVNWLFDVNAIKDAEENINPTNGLLLQTRPNPVISVSDVIVQNTNNMPMQAKVYLMDAAGNKVMDLFEGILNVGDNSISLSNKNIAAGTYFIMSETATGKSYMSIAISK